MDAVNAFNHEVSWGGRLAETPKSQSLAALVTVPCCCGANLTAGLSSGLLGKLAELLHRSRL